MFWKAIGRIILVPIAAVLAAAASGFIVVTLGLERITKSLHQDPTGVESAGALFDIVTQGLILASGLTLIPALAVVLIGEVARIRSSLFYIAGGGAALAAIPLLAGVGQGQGLELPAPAVWQVLGTAGFVGGFVYWLLAGRNA